MGYLYYTKTLNLFTMHTKIMIIILVLIVSCKSVVERRSNLSGPDLSVADNEGWIPLFNGINLDGWIPKVAGYEAGVNALDVFRIENGILRVSYDKYDRFNNRFGHLFYKEPFSEYKLRVEYRFVGEVLPDAPDYCYRNSGVMIQSQSAESMGINQYWPVSIEAQLLGSTDSVKQHTANVCTPGTTVYHNGVFTNEHCIASTSKYYPDSVWVTLDIIVMGSDKICHVIEGDTVLTYSMPQLGGSLFPENYPLPEKTLLREGFISLQAEGQPIEFRKVDLLDLSKEKGPSSRSQ
jgi:hypothetical protein